MCRTAAVLTELTSSRMIGKNEAAGAAAAAVLASE